LIKQVSIKIHENEFYTKEDLAAIAKKAIERNFGGLPKLDDFFG
jgi:hypothetical protein